MTGSRSRALILLALTLLLLNCGLSACSGARHQAQPVDIDTLLAQLPAVPADTEPRQAATPFTTEILGTDTVARGGNCEESGSRLELAPPAGEYAWALYELGTGGLPVIGLVVDLMDMSGEAYLALADYDRGNWTMTEWTEAQWSESGAYELALSSAAISPTDNVYFAVLAAPEHYVEVSWLSLTVDRPGWTVYAVEDTPAVGHEIDLFVQDDLPMMAYRAASTNGAVKFARATLPLPTADSQWVTMTVEAGADGENLGRPLAAASIGGKPAIAYFESVGKHVRYARATVAEPTSSSDWVAHTACPSVGESHFQIGLAECLGAPRIAFLRYSERAYLASSATARPTPADWELGPVTATGQQASRLTLTAIDNLPVLTMTTDQGAGKRLHVGYAQVHTPTMPSNWEVVPVHVGVSGAASSIAVQQIAEYLRPVVSYIYGDYFEGTAYVARPTVSAPEVIADWVRARLDSNVRATDVTVVDGRPFAIFYNDDEGAVRCAWSRIAEFEDSYDFDTFTLAEDPAITFASVATAAVGDVPVIAYYEDASSQLHFGFFIEE